MIFSIIFVILAALAYWYWRYQFLPKEVRENAADFDADGANDTLQRGYHSRELWSRVWPALACCAIPPLAPALFLRLGLGSQVNWLAPALAFLAVAVLLSGSFARFFTPLLNEARTPTRPDITTWYASPDSKSWPDAAVYKELRRDYPDWSNAELQAKASGNLRLLLIRTWLYARLVAGALALGAVALAVQG